MMLKIPLPNSWHILITLIPLRMSEWLLLQVGNHLYLIEVFHSLRNLVENVHIFISNWLKIRFRFSRRWTRLRFKIYWYSDGGSTASHSQHLFMFKLFKMWAKLDTQIQKLWIFRPSYELIEPPISHLDDHLLPGWNCSWH